MKRLRLGIVALLLAGCAREAVYQTSPPTPAMAILTAEQAGELARQLANEKAKELYTREPFRESHPARLVENSWTWFDRRAYGLGDMEASIRFAPDGSARQVEVLLLDSRLSFPADRP